MDPISLEPIADMPYPPFSLHGKYFDGLILCHYILSTGHFINPMTRKALNRGECLRLDKYSRKYITRDCPTGVRNRRQSEKFCKRGPREVTAAFDMQQMIAIDESSSGVSSRSSSGSSSGGSAVAEISEHVQIARREATLVLQNLFGFPTYRSERCRLYKTQRKSEQVQSQPSLEYSYAASKIPMGLDDNNGMSVSSFNQHDEDHAVQGCLCGGEDGGLVVIDDDQVFWDSALQQGTRQTNNRTVKAEGFESAFPALPLAVPAVGATNHLVATKTDEKRAEVATPAKKREKKKLSRAESMAMAFSSNPDNRSGPTTEPSSNSVPAASRRTTAWPNEMLLWARTNPWEVNKLEQQLQKLLSSTGGRSSSKLTSSLQLKPMDAPTRKLVHLMATAYGLRSASYDCVHTKRQRGSHGGHTSSKSFAGRYVSIVKQRDSGVTSIPSPLLSVAAAMALPPSVLTTAAAVSEQTGHTAGKGNDADRWVLIEQQGTQGIETVPCSDADCDQHSTAVTTAGNSSTSSSSGSLAGGGRWGHSKLKVIRKAAIPGKSKSGGLPQTSSVCALSTSQARGVARADARSRGASGRAEREAESRREPVKVGVYNRLEGERVVSLPRMLVDSMVLEDETLWHQLRASAPQPESREQCAGHKQCGRTGAANGKGAHAEAGLVHMWVRTACGDACLVETMPPSFLWV